MILPEKKAKKSAILYLKWITCTTVVVLLSLFILINVKDNSIQSSDVTTKGASDSCDYFLGKWEVFVKGTPGGDTQLILDLKRENDVIGGKILKGDETPIEIFKTIETTRTLEIFFKHKVFTVSLLIIKSDGNEQCECKLAGIYDGVCQKLG